MNRNGQSNLCLSKAVFTLAPKHDSKNYLSYFGKINFKFN